MDEITTIPKERTLPASLDYELLRAEGLKYLEDLGHLSWTDFNAHDPGITVLEALCYVMTELGYRTGFPMRDLLTKDSTHLADDQVLYTAKQILTNNPLTINDYRKVLIDIIGVHNAWLFAENSIKSANGVLQPINEVPIFANCKADQLQYETTDVPLFLSGLYKVLLDLDNSLIYGDMNNGEILDDNPALGGRYEKGEFQIALELTSWKSADFDFAALAASAANIDTIVISGVPDGWAGKLTLTNGKTEDFVIDIPKKPASSPVTLADLQTMLGDKDYMASRFKFYLDKITESRRIVKTAIKKLQERRNLCEDFLEVTTVEDEEIAFCFDVDVKPAADIEKVEAEIFYAIENYLNPSVDFFSLKERLELGIPVDEIFEGVVLEHGFIDTQQLEKTQLRSVVYTSDIINLLMDIDGVLAIRNFVMTKYGDNGKPVPGFLGLKWCMKISPYHKPVLSIDKSKILLFKNQFPFIARYEEVYDTVSMFHAQRSRAKLFGTQDDLPLPIGTVRDTSSFWPLQYDFPQTYGIGEAGLPANATQERISQQRQLKAYLMFFEQLLADFLTQLTEAPKLFSTADITHTYFASFLGDIKDIKPIYTFDGLDFELHDAIINADSATTVKNRWKPLYEPTPLYEDRRGRFLDHMLARFAESFNDYALMLYRLNYEDRSETKIDFATIKNARIFTLMNYPDISANRGKAFNYFPQKADFSIDTAQLWDTKNVSGLEKRICSLTGIADYSRRFLYCIQNIEIICTEKPVMENGVEVLHCFHSFHITSIGGTVMTSKEYEKKSDAEAAVMEVIERAKDTASYSVQENGGKFYIQLGDILMSEAGFNSSGEAQDEIKAIAAEFSAGCKDPEGLHLLEHILLRPRMVPEPEKKFDLMPVCLHECDCPCELDPYSFRASVVLPYWPGHFDNMAFREYFETRIREEAPAHVMLKICWLNNDLLREFEIRYKKWIEALALYAFDQKQANLLSFRDANDKMIEILSQLHSEYPLANLHDCEESKEGSNTVVLGRTVLGTFKNQ